MKSRMLWHYAATGGSYRPFANHMIQFSFADPKTKSNNVKKICWEDDLCVFVLPRLWKQKLRCEFTETMRADNVSPVITGEDNHRDKCLIQYTNIWYLHKAQSPYQMHRLVLPVVQYTIRPHDQRFWGTDKSMPLYIIPSPDKLKHVWHHWQEVFFFPFHFHLKQEDAGVHWKIRG